MKAVLKNDPGYAPGFRYTVKSIDYQAGTVTLAWFTRDYNETTVDLEDVELVNDEVE